jgi:hypothetical protein
MVFILKKIQQIIILFEIVPIAKVFRLHDMLLCCTLCVPILGYCVTHSKPGGRSLGPFMTTTRCLRGTR